MTPTIHTDLDFDGTVTDVEMEAVPYVEGYKADLANRLGLFTADLGAIWAPVEQRILASPTTFGWTDEQERIVAPATADPMILTRVTASEILQSLRDDPRSLGIDGARSLSAALPQDAAAKAQLLDEFFKGNYKKLETHFRPGAADFLASLLEIGRLTVITNSGMEDVLRKLDKLRERHPSLPDIEVVGNAKKYVIVPDFVIEGVAAELDLSPHLVRPVFTQRGKYHQALKGSGIFEADSKVVAGDVWELDLLLIFLLKMKGALITRPMTPEHEIAIVEQEVARGRAKIAADLEGLLAAIKKLHDV